MKNQRSNAPNAIKIFLVAVLMLSFSQFSFCQNIDSLEQLLQIELADTTKIYVLNELIWELAENDTEKALQLNDEAKELASKLKKDSKTWLEKADYNYGTIYRVKGKYETSREYYNKYKKAKEEANDTEGVASVLYQLAIMNYNQGNYEGAMDDYLESYDLFASLKDTLNMARALDGVSSVYYGLGKNDISLEKRKESVRLYEIIGDPKGLQVIYQNMAVGYGRLNKLDSAEMYFLKTEEYIKVNKDSHALGYLYENIGTLHAIKGDFETCKDYVKKSLDIREKLGGKRELVFSYEKYGDVLGYNNEGRKGITYLDKALKLAEEAGLAPAREQVHRTLIRNHKKIGDFEKALFHAEKARKLQDSLVSERTTLQINELDAKYQNSIIEKENISLNAENKIKDTRNFWMTIGLLASLLFLGIILYFLRQRAKTNKLLSEQNTVISNALEEKNILLKEIHHRVKNNLQVISSLLNLQSRYIKDEKAVEAINEGRTRVRSMALIHQSLYQKENLTDISVRDYFEQLTKELFDTYKIDENNIKLELDVMDLDLDVDTMIPIGLIVNELVTNSLKYAFEGKENGVINVSLKEEESDLILEVKDDGVGMNNLENLEKPNSFGYKLINAFSKKMKADLSVNSNNGTSVSLRFKKDKLSS